MAEEQIAIPLEMEPHHVLGMITRLTNEDHLTIASAGTQSFVDCMELVELGYMRKDHCEEADGVYQFSVSAKGKRAIKAVTIFRKFDQFINWVQSTGKPIPESMGIYASDFDKLMERLTAAYKKKDEPLPKNPELYYKGCRLIKPGQVVTNEI